MEREKRDVNDLVEVNFINLNMAQMIFVQAVLVPEIVALIDAYADSLVELGD